MTPYQLARLRELDAEASPAPWVFTGAKRTGYDTMEPGDLLEGNGLGLIPEIERACPPTDAQLIAEARNAIPELIAEIERLTAENTKAWEDGYKTAAHTYYEGQSEPDDFTQEARLNSPYKEAKE